MASHRDDLLLREFKKALWTHNNEPYSNLDDKFNQKFDLIVTRYEDVIKVAGTNIPPHKWSYHRIGLLTNGEASYTCGMYRFRAKKNTLLIMPARMITTSEWTTNGCGYTTLFNADFFVRNNLSYKLLENKGILQHSGQPYLYLSRDQSANVEEVFKAILKEQDSDASFKSELIALKIVELLILCERYYSDTHNLTHNSQTIDLFKKFTYLIEHHFPEEHSVTFYAQRLHVHPNYLNAIIKANTDFTAKESIQNRILLEAKYLLHTTNLSVKEISVKIGFDDPNYFNAFFKRLEKISPLSYRNSFI